MIGVAMGNDGAVHWADGIDIEIAGFAIETRGAGVKD
jgi:hypothetical protein